MTLERPVLIHNRDRTCNGFSLVELLVTIGIVAVLAVMVSMGVSRMTEGTRGVECMSNLRALGHGILRYTIDYEGRLPVRLKPVNSSTAQQWHREIWPSFRGENDTRDWAVARDEASKANYKKWQFHCPADRNPTTTTPGLSYAINVRLTDAKTVQLRQQVLLLELKNRYMTTGSDVELKDLPNRHRMLNHALFTDYHIESLKAKDVPSVHEAPNFWLISP